MNYKISIIVPVFNVQEYLDICVESVLNQTIGFENIELILINDGSSDKSNLICEKYKKKYNNVKYINQKNHGVSYTRNEGMKLSKGKYILFLDSDDFISNNTCEDLYNFFEAHYDEVDIVTYPIMRFRNGKYNMHYRYKLFYDKGTNIYDVNINPYISQANVNVIIKNNCEELFNTKMRFVEDEDFVTRIIMKKGKIGFVNSARYYYINRSDNANNTIRVDKDVIKSVFDNYGKLLDMFNYNIYVQSLFINCLRWRMDECALYPCDIETRKYIKEKISILLNKIDNMLIIKYPRLKNIQKVHLLRLKNEKLNIDFNDKYYQLKYNDYLLERNNHINVKIIRCYVLDKKIYLSIGLNSSIFNVIKPKVYIEYGSNRVNLDIEKSKNDNYFYDGNIYISNCILNLNRNRKINIYVELDNHIYLCNLVYSNYKNYYSESVVIKKNKILIHSNKKKGININYSSTSKNKLNSLFNGVINKNELNSKISFFKVNKLIVDENNIVRTNPFNNKIKYIKDLLNYSIYYIYDGNNNYENNREYSLADYVIVKSEQEKKDVINNLDYLDNEIIVIK